MIIIRKRKLFLKFFVCIGTYLGRPLRNEFPFSLTFSYRSLSARCFHFCLTFQRTNIPASKPSKKISKRMLSTIRQLARSRPMVGTIIVPPASNNGTDRRTMSMITASPKSKILIDNTILNNMWNAPITVSRK